VHRVVDPVAGLALVTGVAVGVVDGAYPYAEPGDREHREMVTAFVPNQAQLGAILRLLH
jgi:hypothetical protein